MRAFWERESDSLVGRVLSGLIDIYVVTCNLGDLDLDDSLVAMGRQIVDRLTGRAPVTMASAAEGFLGKEYEMPNVYHLPIEFPVAQIIERRLNEARAAQSVGAHLAVIFLCGSVLEGVLLGAAQKDPAKFNRSPASPKRDGKVKSFHEWSLAELIDVACDIDVLKPDVKRFSHGLRYFRNYIHPYEQMASNFTPDEHTAKVCFQVLKAALASVAGERL